MNNKLTTLIGNFSNFLFPAKYLVLIVFFNFSFSLYAMNKEEIPCKSVIPPSPKNTIHIVSPEGVEITKNISAIAQHCPRIAQSNPQIDSLEIFKLAKEYLALSKRYEYILCATAVVGVKPELFEESQRVLKGMVSYIGVLCGKSCNSFRSEEEDKDLDFWIFLGTSFITSASFTRRKSLREESR